MAKKTISAAKKPAAKKPAAKKPATKKPEAKKPEANKPAVKRVPPRITRKVPASVLSQADETFTPIDTDKAVAFAMSIAHREVRGGRPQGVQAQAA